MESRAKARTARGATLGFLLAAAIWLVGVWPPPVWWRNHWPRQTAMMQRADAQAGGRAPIALEEIAPVLGRVVIIGEDSRFWTHQGIDVVELRDALGVERLEWDTLREIWRRRRQLRGASTISQQLAKNLYLSPSRSLLRKLKEAVTALRLELALPKERILELYLNLAEWGPGIWGVERASREYFGVAAGDLTEWQAAALAATLPFPRSSNPAYRPSRMEARQRLILARLHGVEVLIPPEPEEFELPPIELLPVPLPALDSPAVRVPERDDTAPDTTKRR